MVWKMSSRFAFILLILLAHYSKEAIIGFDFGTEFYKGVLVKPGSPFRIVENTSSKRKTENGV